MLRAILVARCFTMLRLITAVLVIVLTCRTTFGQDSKYRQGSPDTQSKSRAEVAAEEVASLSAERIRGILNGEPGLLLQVKKELFKRAFGEGRIINVADLSDESLFRLLEEDDQARILATREIVERGYIQVKPTKEELQAQKDAERETSRWGSGRQQTFANSGERNRWRSRSYQYSLPRRRYQDSTPGHDYNGDAGTSQPPVYEERRPPMNRQTQLQNPFAIQPTLVNRAGSQANEFLPPSLSAELPPQSQGQVTANEPRTMPEAVAGGAVAEEDRSSMAREPGIQTGQSMGRPSSAFVQHPYPDLPSYNDLFWQYPPSSARLGRFGEEVFRNGSGNADLLPGDLPAGPDYVIGPGDGLTIDLWGGVSQRLQRSVDREGRLALPEAGVIQVAGKSLGEVQHLVQSAFRTQFRDAQADVSLSRLRSVHIYVVGDVERPGAYDVSSLSTPLNALYLAGGPTAQGSMRVVNHYRGETLVQKADIYDLLLHGIHSDVRRFEPGDVVQVPAAGAQVAIEGMVRRPAIYELNGENNLAQALDLAGGILAAGSLEHVEVERSEAGHKLTRLRIDLPEHADRETAKEQLDAFAIQDDDKIKISPILPHADRTVYLDGHVFRPGKFAYREGMKVSDLVKSYDDLLPESSLQHAEIIRLKGPNYTPGVLTFNLADALNGKDQNLVLEPFDTVRIFSRFEFEDPPLVTVSGEVRHPGDHITNGAVHLRDAIYAAGGITPDAMLDEAQIFRSSQDGKLQVIGVNLGKALSGDRESNILLAPKDRIVIHRAAIKTDSPLVTIQGEVATPGHYPLTPEMTAAALVRLAGGFKRGAYTETAELTRYSVQDGAHLQGEHSKVAIADALAGHPDADVKLHDGDVLTIAQREGWKDVGATVSVKGEVEHPGAYGIAPGELLSSVIARAGGFSGGAFPYGTVFARVQVRELEEKNHAALIREIQDQEPSLGLSPENDPQEKAAKQAALQQWKSTLDQLQNTAPAGRLVIHISANMKRWAKTAADPVLRAGDTIFIPKRPNLVMVNGSVYNPTAINYRPGKNAGWYLQQAGGPNAMANKKAIFVIRADGSVAGGTGGLLGGGAERVQLAPGDMVVVPEKAFSANTRWKSTLEGAQLAYAVGIAIQVARSF